MKALISALLACATLSACATTYVGPRPDFTKTGDAAKSEYEKFEAGTAYGNFNLYSIKMGDQVYERDSVAPIINDVSPMAASKIQHMQVARYIGYGIFVATMISIFQSRDSWANQTGYWIGLGGILGTGIYINVSGMNAAEDYNKDLKSKFTPSLAVTGTF